MSYLDEFEHMTLEHEIRDNVHYFEMLDEHPGIAAGFRGLLLRAERAGEFTPTDLKDRLSICLDSRMAVIDGYGDLWLVTWDGKGGVVATLSCKDLPHNLGRFGFDTLRRFVAWNPDTKFVPFVPQACRAAATATAPAA